MVHPKQWVSLAKEEKSFCWVFNTSMRKHPYLVHIIHPEIHSMRGGKEKASILVILIISLYEPHLF